MTESTVSTGRTSEYNGQKVTIYYLNSFGVKKVEAKLHFVKTGKYAQYLECPFIVFTPKGKRKAIQWAEGYRPYAIIVDGWKVPLDPAQPFEDIGGGMQQTTYTSYDPRWHEDFDKVLEASDVELMVDFRGQEKVNHWASLQL